MDALKTAPPEAKASLIQSGEKWIAKHNNALGAVAETVVKAIGGTTSDCGKD